ncbi:SCO family protein [Adhaeribacter radiodurans]|uniref:SCO family protein n=1 Tax=Adhaeribacter radiodurans TaxID=2745197 RepID=A0A7L7L371_9BACT|nr:SCO family protein [Adhaeribacter radiodurans]QMU27210.1 SCO family protein [Adhaeribacter radiodurans]
MSPKKVLMLGILLLVPIFLFLFLKGFGTNHYSLPTYYPTINEDTELPVVKDGDTVFQKVPDFRFVSQEGKSVSQADLNNTVYVANFFFASCQDVCKKMSAQMVRVNEAFKNNPQVKLISYTVDPERDSVAVLKRYAEMYQANPAKWLFVTGPKTELYALAHNGYKVSAMQAPGTIPDFIHSEKLILVDKEKHVRGIYDGTNPQDVDRLITEITVLLHSYQQDEK